MNPFYKLVHTNVDHCRKQAEKSQAIVTPLAKHFGYDLATNWAMRALSENKSIREIARDEGMISDQFLNELLDLDKMTRPDKA